MFKIFLHRLINHLFFFKNIYIHVLSSTPIQFNQLISTMLICENITYVWKKKKIKTSLIRKQSLYWLTAFMALYLKMVLGFREFERNTSLLLLAYREKIWKAALVSNKFLDLMHLTLLVSSTCIRCLY